MLYKFHNQRVQVSVGDNTRHDESFRQRAYTALTAAKQASELPSQLAECLGRLYESSCTQTVGDRWKRPKQGDPLFPFNFNIMIDQLLRTLPQECNATFNKRTICIPDSTDDLVILIDSAVELHLLINHTTVFLHECGMELNSVKSHMVIIFGHHWQTTVGASAIFRNQRPSASASA